MLKLLTNKDSFIRKKIIDQNLAYLNNRLTHYLDKLGLPHQVIFTNDLALLNEGTQYRNLPQNLVTGGITRRFGTDSTLFPGL